MCGIRCIKSINIQTKDHKNRLRPLYNLKYLRSAMAYFMSRTATFNDTLLAFFGQKICGDFSINKHSLKIDYVIAVLFEEHARVGNDCILLCLLLHHGPLVSSA